MLNRKQNQVINKLISDSDSYMSGSEGRGVAVFTASKDIENALIENGFSQNIRKDKFNTYYGHTCWWNENAQILVSYVAGKNTWTAATEKSPLQATEFASPV